MCVCKLLYLNNNHIIILHTYSRYMMFQWSCMENAHKTGCHLQTRVGANYRQRVGAIYRQEWVPSTGKIGCHLQARLGAIYRQEWVPSTGKSGCHLQARLGAIYTQEWVQSTDMIGYHLQIWFSTICRHDWVPSRHDWVQSRHDWVPSTDMIGYHLDMIGYNPQTRFGYHLHTRLGTIHRHDWVPSTDKIGYQLQTQYMNKHLLNAQWLTTITVIFKTKLQWDTCNAAASVQAAHRHILHVAENSGTDKSREQNCQNPRGQSSYEW